MSSTGRLNIYATPMTARRGGNTTGRRPTTTSSHLTITPRRVQIVDDYVETKPIVKLSWHIFESVNMIDWIGMYEIGESDPFRYIDCKSDGVCGQTRGQVHWTLARHMFAGQMALCFKYYDGLTGVLRACSPILIVAIGGTARRTVPELTCGQLIVTALECKQLSHSRSSIYYAKLRCANISYKTACMDTPNWRRLVGAVYPLPQLPFIQSLHFALDRSKELQLLIKEKCWSKSRLIGEASAPIADLADQFGERQLAFVLRRPSIASSPSRFTAQILLSINVVAPSTIVPAPSRQQPTIDHIRSQSIENEVSIDEHQQLPGPSSNGTTTTTTTSVVEAPIGEQRPTSTDRQSADLSFPASFDLPTGWEARVDCHGRVFYVDHLSRRTTWTRPNASSTTEIMNRHSANQRHIMPNHPVPPPAVINRRTIASNAANENEDNNTPPVVQLLQRVDFVSMLHRNEQALTIYQSNGVQHMVHRIRRDARLIDRYQNNRDFVAFINAFADRTQPLPTGWQQMMVSGGGVDQIVFVDHIQRKTTLFDPRLPYRPVFATGGARRRTRSAPNGRSGASQNTAHDHNGNVIDLVQRSEFIEWQRRRHKSIDAKLARKLANISRLGQSALQRYANDIDVITLISSFESEMHISPFVNTAPDQFERTLADFYATIERRGYGHGPAKLKFRLRRQYLMTDAFDQLLAADSGDLQRNRLIIVFDDEDGLDYGGPSREFFYLLSRALFNPYYGLFEYSANDTYTVQISPLSIFVDNYHQWFRVCGRMLALALIHRHLIDTFFTLAFYKFLLQLPCSIGDLQAMDSQFHNSLQWLHENTVSPDLELTFCATEEIIEKELIVNGKNTPVTDANKHDYIRRMIQWRVERGVHRQAHALITAFHEVIDAKLLSVFDARQLELVLSGTVEIDLNDWRRNTEYKGGYSDGHVVIDWFWQVVERFSNAQRLQLLQFVTGTSSIPYDGFAVLRGSNGPKKFTIDKWGDSESLPRAHTCFNRLDLPPYTCMSTMYNKLLLAIIETVHYGIE